MISECLMDMNIYRWVKRETDIEDLDLKLI